jgi:predicted DNA-binding mobile mystery protein A
MKAEYREVRLKQLSQTLAPFAAAKPGPRPLRGWLRAIREALGMTLEEVGRVSRTTKQRIQRFEESEANDRITLRNLRRVAGAMDCELVYAIVPKSGTITDLAEHRARRETTKRVLSVEHTMALEDQAPGGVKDLIDEETKRIRKKP